ncbi:Protein ABHD14B [Armadillidium vulgare]|nr:Protein ABHD14B [Armadillidium vulgare]
MTMNFNVRPSVLLPIILLFGGLFIFTLLSLSDNKEDQIPRVRIRNQRNSNVNNSVSKLSNMDNFWKKVNFQEITIPASVGERANDVQIRSNRVNIMNVDTFYREAHPPPGVESSHQSVLLLHGANFKSLTWVELKTINQLAAMGHRVVAVDLPGYGETKSTVGDKGNYLKEFIDRMKLQNFIIVSPSMSGGFSIPYIIKNSKDLDGYVPVAPVHTNEIVHDAPNIMTLHDYYGELRPLMLYIPKSPVIAAQFSSC